MSSPFNILKESPHDRVSPPFPEPEDESRSVRWVPSRYNIRATAGDGRLILWNTYSGAMSVFRAQQTTQVTSLLKRKGVLAKPEGLIKYLADRGFLLREGVNEYRQVQVAISQQQYRTDRLELILLASEDCNFRCNYCYEKFERGTMEPWVREGIKHLVEKRLKTLSSLQVSWFGGEPLYGWKAIEDLAPFFLRTAEESDIFYSSGMTTNGYLLTPDVADKLLAWKVKSFQVTLDGAPEDHNRSRPARDGKETFAQIFDNLVALSHRSEHFDVTLRVNFDRENHPRLDDFLSRVEMHFGGDSRFHLLFFPVGRWGGPEDAKLNVCGTAEAQQVKEQMKAEARRRGLRVGTIKGVNRLGGEVCYAARPYNFIIGASGKVMKCTIALDTEDYNVVGALKENGDIQLDVDRMALWTEPAFENDNRCQKCVVLPICQGTHCPLIRIVDNKSPCCGLRSRPKTSLLEVLDQHGADARRSVVESTQVVLASS